MTQPKKDRWDQLADDINKGYINVENGSRLVLNTDKIIHEGLSYYIDDVTNEVLSEIMTEENLSDEKKQTLSKVIETRTTEHNKKNNYKESFEKLTSLFPSFQKAS